MGRRSQYIVPKNFGECRKCGTKVECVDSRATENHRRRRWKCPKCGDRFTTREVYAEDWDIAMRVKRIPEQATNLVRSLASVLNITTPSPQKVNFQGIDDE